MVLYAYKVIREDINGNRGKRVKTLLRYEDELPLKIGGLYSRLGKGYPGMHRILDMEVRRYPDAPEKGYEWNENNG